MIKNAETAETTENAETSGSNGATEIAEFKAALVALTPSLRAFAMGLCNNWDDADDLVQDALLRAWRARSSYKTGSNMKAWAFTILRNVYFSQCRRSWRSTPLDPEVAERTLSASANAEDRVELAMVNRALAELADDQREAVLLVGAMGLDYREAARLAGCRVGTMKSRVSRGRKALGERLAAAEAGRKPAKAARTPAPLDRQEFGAQLMEWALA